MNGSELMQEYGAQQQEIWNLQNKVVLLLQILEMNYAEYCESKGLEGEKALAWLEIFMRQYRQDVEMILLKLNKIDQDLLDLCREKRDLSWHNDSLEEQLRKLKKKIRTRILYSTGSKRRGWRDFRQARAGRRKAGGRGVCAKIMPAPAELVNQIGIKQDEDQEEVKTWK